MNNTQTGTVTGVHGKCIFIANDLYSTIYAHRDALHFSDPYIGLEVKFELHILPNMRDPVAANVRRAG
jgi:hypothetical protein